MNDEAYRQRFLRETQPMRVLLERTGRVLRRSWVAVGGGLLLGWCFAGLAVAVVADLVFGLPVPLRMLGWGAVVVPSLVLLVAGVVLPLARRLGDDTVAREIESTLPGMHNRLVSCVELMRNGQRQVFPASFCLRLLDETRRRLDGFQPGMVVKRRALHGAGVFCGGAAAALLAAVVAVFPARSMNALQRIAWPHADLPPLASVRYAVEPGDAAQLRGDSLTIRARVQDGHADDGLDLVLHPATGAVRRLRYPLREVEPGVWAFTLDALEQSFTYRVVGGGTWSRRHGVTVSDRPELTELRTVLHWPDYLEGLAPQPSEPNVADVAGPVGSRVEVEAAARGEVLDAEVRLYDDDPAVTNRAEQVARAAVPMERGEDGRWRGSFPLVTGGLYRVVLRNPAGIENERMQPARFTALIDGPPAVAVERPGSDLALSRPSPVPLVVAVSDDMGLAELTLTVFEGNADTGTGRSLKTFPVGARSDAVVTSLDLAPYDLQPGGFVRYRLEVRDRKGLTAQTGEYKVRVTPQGPTADKQLASMGETEDAFAARLSEVSQAQDELETRLEAVVVRYTPLLERIEEAAPDTGERAVLQEVERGLSTSNLVVLPITLELDEESLAELEAMRSELGEIALAQNLNAERAQAFAQEIARALEQSGTVALLPAEYTHQLYRLQRSFEELALEPMQGVIAALQEGAEAEAVVPDFGLLQRLAASLQRGLQRLTDDLGMLSTASSLVQDDPAEALAKLEEARLVSQANLMSHDLHTMEDMLADMEKEMKRLQGKQERLYDEVLEAKPDEVPELDAEQRVLEEDIDGSLEEARALLMGAPETPEEDPVFPEAPYVPDHGDYYVPPKEQDTLPEPDPEAMAAAAKSGPDPEASAEEDGEDGEEDEEDPLHPMLGGPAPQLDPRYADDSRPTRFRLFDGARAERRELSDRQWHRLQELETARASVASDREALQQMAGQLGQAAREMSGQGAPVTAGELEAMMQSAQMQQALAMASRMQAARAAAGGAAGQSPGEQEMAQVLAAALFSSGASDGSRGGDGSEQDAEPAAAIDAGARGVLLGLQPQQREELLQGMRERGPEAYQRFIRDYFQQLTKVKDTP